MKSELNQDEYNLFASFLLEFGRELNHTQFSLYIPEDSITHDYYHNTDVSTISTYHEKGLVVRTSETVTITDKCIELLKEYNENGR